MDTLEFLETFNYYYPFERYIMATPRKINFLFDDLMLTELFVPATEYRPITAESGELIYTTSVATESMDKIYVKCSGKCGGIRLALTDFAEHIQEEICRDVIRDMGGTAFENLYVEFEDDENVNALREMLTAQKRLITGKYGICQVKGNFETESTLNLLQDI